MLTPLECSMYIQYLRGQTHELVLQESTSLSILNNNIQWNLSIMVTLGPNISGLYIQVAVVEKTCIRWSAAF